MSDVLSILFQSDFGILSLITIGVVIYMGFYLSRFVKRHVAEDTAKAAKNVH